jgi:hypothetical protein
MPGGQHRPAGHGGAVPYPYSNTAAAFALCFSHPNLNSTP